MSARAEHSRRAAALARAARTETAQEKAERYAELLRGGYTPQQACWELGVSRRTGHRYQAALAAREAS